MSHVPVPGASGFVLNINKPERWTSHDTVQRVRRILKLRKVGHTGTLDPFATGVLLCCVGRATKLSNYLMDLTKEYAGAMLFGVRTTTGDIAGEVVEQLRLPLPPLDALAAAARQFEGESLQVPPMVSALKHHGERLYALARRGITVEREPRTITIESFEILGADEGRIHFRVRCSRGTYVRTLVEDFGARLGATACVEQLCRTRVGAFSVEEAADLTGALDAAGLRARGVSMAEALSNLSAWRIPSFWVRKLRDGHAPPWAVVELEVEPREGEVGRLLGATGELVALGRAVPYPGPADRPWHEALSLELVRVI
ncbi:MAG: tRNA pseudouridine(55) synthase TruB [Candidatus Eisenbacteria sp.]|nr:tRNA pseudouridine(55) synthase TruB [Candidatus Eisenbacteria bacterium]